MPPLNVVALISGGKDSLFSICHCLRNGHNVVALGNLFPPSEVQGDMDSFMYQTVGHNIVEVIAQAVELPLYRQQILGFAHDTSKSYGPSTSDETDVPDEVESMYTLLQTVIQTHPEVNAVCTGAILSDYQRTRVESVAIRLGLTPLSYLWQFPRLPPYSESQLLADMSAAGQDSRIIKVASGGMDESYLWRNVADASTILTLQRAAQRFGATGDGAVLGEGGEYETLTISGPSQLWKYDIQVEEQNRLVNRGEAGTSNVQLRDARLVRRNESAEGLQFRIRIPPLFDHRFDEVRRWLPSKLETLATMPRPMPLTCSDRWSGSTSTSAYTLHCNARSSGTDAAEQVSGMMKEICNASGGVDTVIHTTILLRSMDDFPAVNSVYGDFFTLPNPPSRVTIACGAALPAGVHASISAISIKPQILHRRDGLHVQSRSYWAPANIGPYSQAISSPVLYSQEDDGSTRQPSVVHVAGQIPLTPSTMELHNPESTSAPQIALETCLLALQHLWRIGTAMNVNVWLGGMLFVGRDATDGRSEAYARAAVQAWRAIHAHPDDNGDSDEVEDGDGKDFDVWDLRHGYGGPGREGTRADTTVFDTIKRDCIPPMFVAEVQTLPRNAPVEWSSVGWREAGAAFDVEDVAASPSRHRLYSSRGGRRLATWIGFRTLQDLEGLLGPGNAPPAGLCTLYCVGNQPERGYEVLKPQVVPCFRLWDEQGSSLAAVLCCYECMN